MDQADSQRIQEFLNREFTWQFSAGECNFLIQLLIFLIQENPAIVRNEKGDKEPLNYQSIRTIVLLNEKLSGMLHRYAEEASVVVGSMKTPVERVQ